MRSLKCFLLAAAAASLLASSHAAPASASASAPGAAHAQSTPAAGPGWHHVADFPPAEKNRCDERGHWYLENGVRAYECRANGVWELWVLTEPS
ncbi:hypothetical protein GCM10010329_62350 [Streptomyces spiroverticillatus]|uniref:Uncharacterized protein n=1 Tax=Streptomyces finlayi TaxID=67296 RepID=A0A918X6N2_9ACTN|nr:hypothetical protein GCM10010329_62350 [Streptomyces spiroverticillatus]GHD14722.1 hypothetical protein GCM10010334_74080 [Streptomyces finlayi]